MALTPELESLLNEALSHLRNRQTVVFVFDDMVAINERFQAVLEWFKEAGEKQERRWGTGVLTKSGGWIYFVGADTHSQPTRGAAAEYDLRPHAEQLVRKTGLEARLREAAERAKSQKQCCGAKDRGEPVCSDCPVEVAA